MNTELIMRNLKEGYKYPGIKSNYLWTVVGIGVTGSLYALGEPKIGDYMAICTATFSALNFVKQYGKGKIIKKKIEL